MKGCQITFFTQQDRRHGHLQMHEWLTQQADALGIRGSTVLMASEGVDRAGRRHSARFFELADQPMEVTMVMTDEQAARLFERLEQEQAEVFYVKSMVEFGIVGGRADPAGTDDAQR